jgi:hypothetical protein
LSQFLERFKARIQAKKRAKQTHQHQDESSPTFASTNIAKTLNTSHWFSSMTKLGNKTISPAQLSNALTLGLILLSILCATYWFLRFAQLPTVPLSNAGASKGVTLYSNQELTNAYPLFGSKPLVTDTIFLRGVVITSPANSEHLDGFAIFEIDGKQTPAIGIGENLGKGLVLQSLGAESATLLYEGQKLDFKLTKSGGSSSTNNAATKK